VGRPVRPRASTILTAGRPDPSRLPGEPPAPLTAGPEQCHELGWALQQEWLVTNGLGGYASSTIVGVNTRRYHGLLVAATRPPGARVVLLAKLEETVVTPGTRYDLSTNRYAGVTPPPVSRPEAASDDGPFGPKTGGGVIHPEGFRYQEAFRLDPWPTFVYRIGGMVLEKQVSLVPGGHTTIVSYHLRDASGAIELILRPLVACRDFRWVSQENTTFRTRVEQTPGMIVLHPYEGLPPLVLHHGAELFEETGYWYKRFEYLAEAMTEAVHHEDLYSPGQLVYLLRPGETAELIASTDRALPSHGVQQVARATEARLAILRRARARRAGPLTTRLIGAAEQFLVKGADRRWCLAGYPWCSAGGRSALIALPGLTVATGQPEIARELLATMASHCRDGLLPVRFAEEDGSPQYDSVDTSLWLFWAVDRYLRATGDLRFISRRLLDVLMDIVDYYVQGTQFHILMDQDGLITTAGEERPLTWMDVRVDGRPVTLRSGKAIEVNALWYNALMTMADLGERFRLRLRRQYARLARLVKGNCARLFWNPERGCLYDVVGRPPAGVGLPPDDAVRPNQLFAISLPYPLLSRARAKRLLEVVGRELVTPVGVRTLSPRHPAYQGRWAGTQAQRDAASHQGCAWPWLLGAYWSGYLATYGQTVLGVGALRRALEPFRERLGDRGWGTVPELFDGDPPQTGGGAVAHACAVAELLRLLHEHRLTEV